MNTAYACSRKCLNTSTVGHMLHIHTAAEGKDHYHTNGDEHHGHDNSYENELCKRKCQEETAICVSLCCARTTSGLRICRWRTSCYLKSLWIWAITAASTVDWFRGWRFSGYLLSLWASQWAISATYFADCQCCECGRCHNWVDYQGYRSASVSDEWQPLFRELDFLVSCVNWKRGYLSDYCSWT